MTITAASTAVEVREYRSEEDAGAAARLFHASDAGWPEGFGDGISFSPETIRELDEEDDRVGAYLAWADGLAVGFADLVRQSEEDNVGYLGLLTADPAYHGRGVGRDLIRACVRKCVELGWKRLHLDTWPGNTKALPLYKRTGFHWGLGSGELQNYVPFFLTHPLTKAYFERTDWYAHLKRPIDMRPDDQKRNGALVYPYRWEGPGGTLRAAFDQKTKALVELDTPELRLSLETTSSEAVQGAEVGVTFTIENRRERPLPLAARAAGDGAVSADHTRMAQVAPGATETVSFEATADAEKTGDGSVKLSLLLDGDAVELAAHVKVHAPVELALVPATPALRPNVPERLTLNLRSRLSERTLVRLTPVGSDGLAVKLDGLEVSLEPGQVAGIPLEVEAARGGVYKLVINVFPTEGVVGEQRAAPPLSVDLVAAGPGEAWALRTKEETLLVGERVRVRVPDKGTWLTLFDRETGAEIGGQGVEVGPPFWPSPNDRQVFETAVRQEVGGAAVTLRGEIKKPEGLYLERTILLTGNGEVRTSAMLTNVGGTVQQARVRVGNRTNEEERAAYLPLEQGVLRGEGGLPGWPWAGPGADPPLAARWAAIEQGERTIGFLWPDDFSPRVTPDSWGRLELRSPNLALAPGESRSMRPFRALTSTRDWREVEQAWREEERLAPSNSRILPAAGARIEPSPVLLVRESATVRAVAQTYLPRAYSGEASVSASDYGFSVEPSHLSFGPTSATTPQSASLIVRRGQHDRRAGEVYLDARFPHTTRRVATPVIALGVADGEVRVGEGREGDEAVWRVENGWLSFAVRPSVLGAVYALATPDGELLSSSFPEPEARQWLYPVYGGVTPVVWYDWSTYPHNHLGALDGLSLAAEPVELEGAQGVRWKGIRLGVDLEREELLGLRFEIEYLSVPESNVVAIRSTLRSLGPARPATFQLQVSPSTSPEIPLAVGPDDPTRTWGGARGGGTLTGDRWVSAEYPSSGRNLALVSAGEGLVRATDMDSRGFRLHGVAQAIVPAGGSVRTCHYLAVADDRAQAALYGSLPEIRDPGGE